MNVILDSREGMQILVSWARMHGIVLQPYHAEIAANHGVDIQGVTISRPLMPGAQRVVKG